MAMPLELEKISRLPPRKFYLYIFLMSCSSFSLNFCDNLSQANNREAASPFQTKLVTALFLVKAVREDLKERCINLTEVQGVKMLVDI